MVTTPTTAEKCNLPNTYGDNTNNGGRTSENPATAHIKPLASPPWMEGLALPEPLSFARGLVRDGRDDWADCLIAGS